MRATDQIDLRETSVIELENAGKPMLMGQGCHFMTPFSRMFHDETSCGYPLMIKTSLTSEQDTPIEWNVINNTYFVVKSCVIAECDNTGAIGGRSRCDPAGAS
jgi:hypothetical protein